MIFFFFGLLMWWLTLIDFKYQTSLAYLK